MRNLLLVSLLAFALPPLSAQVSETGVIPLSQERSRDYDAIHYRIELSIDPEGKHLKGQNTITLKPLRDDLRVVKLDAQSLKVTDILDARGFPLEFSQADDKLFVDLTKEYNSTDSISFTIKYLLNPNNYENQNTFNNFIYNIGLSN